MKNKLALLLLLALALPLSANTTLFAKYETVRQGFLKNALGDVKKNAAALASDARAAKNATIAAKADAVAKAANMAKARTAFSALSDEMIKLRRTTKNAKAAVYHCPMVNKSWLQPKGTVGNPYDPTMVKCGVLKE